MKAQKNLFEAPATKVVEIVLDFCQDVHAMLCDEEGDFYPQGIEGLIETYGALQEYKMPNEICKEITLGKYNCDECEELIIRHVTAEYHKSIAS